MSKNPSDARRRGAKNRDVQEYGEVLRDEGNKADEDFGAYSVKWTTKRIHGTLTTKYMKNDAEDKKGLVAGNVYVLTPKPKSAEKCVGLRAFRYDPKAGFVPVACVKVGGRIHWLSESSLARLA